MFLLLLASSNWGFPFRLPEEDRQSEAVAAGLVTQHAALMRNKRCVLAYLNFRLNYIKRLRWELGSGSLAQGYRELMSAEEISFFHSYSQLLTEMHDAYSNVPMDSSSQEETQWLDLDLCTDLTPPSALLVKVRVLTDGGEVATENGSIYLQAHSTQFLPRTDVETLVAQGIVKEVD